MDPSLTSGPSSFRFSLAEVAELERVVRRHGGRRITSAAVFEDLSEIFTASREREGNPGVLPKQEIFMLAKLRPLETDHRAQNFPAARAVDSADCVQQTKANVNLASNENSGKVDQKDENQHKNTHDATMASNSQHQEPARNTVSDEHEEPASNVSASE